MCIRDSFTVFHWLVLGGIVLVTGGVSLTTQSGSWFTDVRYAVPALAIAAGAFVAWYQLDDPAGRRRGRTRARWVSSTTAMPGARMATRWRRSIRSWRRQKNSGRTEARRYFVLLKSAGRFSLNEVMPSRAASVQASSWEISDWSGGAEASAEIGDCSPITDN